MTLRAELGSGSPDTTADIPADELLQQVIDHELTADKEDLSRWMFESRAQGKGHDGTKEVIQTKQGQLFRTLSLNGKPLTEQQQKKEDARIRRIVDSHGSGESERRNAHDARQAEQLLAILPKALLPSYGQRRGDLVELNFKPNPKFHPTSRQARVFRAMEGSIWVNAKEDRLAEIDGHLIQRVDFGGGILGHLDKGGEFHVTQSEVAPGHWEVTQIRVDMKGRVLFFKTIGVQENETRSNFHRVPDSLTLAEAAKRLSDGSSKETGGS
jgi:hypothetical protein